MDDTQDKATIVVAGATGFVGQALPAALGDDYHLIGLSRSATKPVAGYHGLRRADLFSLSETRNALKGADIAIYLVHSMMPSARLVQGHFADLDLMCADNFAKAAKDAGVRRIIYVGALLPNCALDELSEHLASRLEVERALSGSGLPVTTLRAGLVVGHKGSSYQLVARLVRRLPVMICPAWTQSRMQPIGLSDLVQVIRLSLPDTSTESHTYDVASGETLSYVELMKATALSLGLRRLFLRVPVFSTRLSRLWVSLTTGAPKALVAPLVQSLKHDMLVRSGSRWRVPGFNPESIWVHLEKAALNNSRVSPRAFRSTKTPFIGDKVHSVQRFIMPAGRSTTWAARRYFEWLPTAFFGVIRVHHVEPEDRYNFRLVGSKRNLLSLRIDHESSHERRLLLRIVGGTLVLDTKSGYLEFRSTLEQSTLLVAIHDFSPSLPWWLYRATQAQAHLFVMRRFRRHLERFDASAARSIVDEEA
jgi:uncharacterized protein YbjT (DUF2867 family)